jgi:outer membrane protein assembly factor BamE (lipoprotein component of BamABCDE complex)
MKILYASLAFLVCVAISAGCSTAEKTDTHTGDSVANIVENKTTAEELVRMFGEPHVKTKTSRDEEKWVYTFITDKSKRRYSID